MVIKGLYYEWICLYGILWCNMGCLLWLLYYRCAMVDSLLGFHGAHPGRPPGKLRQRTSWGACVTWVESLGNHEKRETSPAQHWEMPKFMDVYGWWIVIDRNFHPQKWGIRGRSRGWPENPPFFSSKPRLMTGRFPQKWRVQNDRTGLRHVTTNHNQPKIANRLAISFLIPKLFHWTGFQFLLLDHVLLCFPKFGYF